MANKLTAQDRNDKQMRNQTAKNDKHMTRKMATINMVIFKCLQTQDFPKGIAFMDTSK